MYLLLVSSSCPYCTYFTLLWCVVKISRAASVTAPLSVGMGRMSDLSDFDGGVIVDAGPNGSFIVTVFAANL